MPNVCNTQRERPAGLVCSEQAFYWQGLLFFLEKATTTALAVRPLKQAFLSNSPSQQPANPISPSPDKTGLGLKKKEKANKDRRVRSHRRDLDREAVSGELEEEENVNNLGEE